MSTIKQLIAYVIRTFSHSTVALRKNHDPDTFPDTLTARSADRKTPPQPPSPTPIKSYIWHVITLTRRRALYTRFKVNGGRNCDPDIFSLLRYNLVV